MAKVEQTVFSMPRGVSRQVLSDRFALHCDDPSLAQQQFRDDSNPNKIMEQFARTRDANLLNVTRPSYGDFTGVVDYHSALNAVIAAQDAFDALPSKIRNRFENDPAKFLDFMADEANTDEARSLGLLDVEPAPARSADSAVADAGTDAPPSGGIPAGYKLVPEDTGIQVPEHPKTASTAKKKP